MDIIFLINFSFKALKVMAEGDISAINWLFLGFGIISPLYLAIFGLFLIGFSAAYLLPKKYIFKYDEPLPFFIVILFSFIVSGIVLGMYSF